MDDGAHEIRAFALGDIDGTRELWRATEGIGRGPGDEPAPLARFLARNPGLSQVAIAGGAVAGDVVGALLCGHDGRRGFIYRLAVHPDHRRRGLAEEMVRRALDGLRAEGIERCLAFVLRENGGATEFWTAVGGERHGDLEIYSLPIRPESRCC